MGAGLGSWTNHPQMRGHSFRTSMMLPDTVGGGGVLCKIFRLLWSVAGVCGGFEGRKGAGRGGGGLGPVLFYPWLSGGAGG